MHRYWALSYLSLVGLVLVRTSPKEMGNMVLGRSGKAVPKSNQLAESSPISLSLVLLLFFALVDSTSAQV
ncbi:uncharacterized protein Dyak_GE28637, partial [Drosophila yakuba]